MKDFRSVISDYLNKNDRHKKQLAAVVSLSMLVSFTVPMILQEPASSMTGDSFTPVSDILSTKLFNAASDHMVENYAKADGNDGKSPQQLSEVTLLIGDPVETETREWLKGCETAEQVIEAIKKEYFLGIASDFCVFLKEDFTPTNSDAEGRVAVGGNVKFDGGYNYQIGSGDYEDPKTALELVGNYADFTGFASLITNGTIENINTYNKDIDDNHVGPMGKYKRLVVDKFDENTCTHWSAKDTGSWSSGQKYATDCNCDDVTKNELACIYTGKSIMNVAEQFTYIQSQSDKLSKTRMTADATAVWTPEHNVIFSNDDSYNFTGYKLTCTVPEGCTDETVYFKIDDWHELTEVEFINIPYLNEEHTKIANIVINCGSDTITIDNKNLYDSYDLPKDNASNIVTKINGTIISKPVPQSMTGDNHNNHIWSENILYNFHNATDLTIDANFNGTLLAPNAAAHSSLNEDGSPKSGGRGHLSGSLIAKSYKGGSEFGYRPYRGTVDILPSSSGYGVPIKKIKPNGDALAGATFGIFKQDSDTPETTFKSDENGNGYVNIPSQVDFSGDTTYTDANNTITNTYVIKETEAPAGFVRDDNTTYQITVTETIDINSMHENADGTKIPAKVITQVVSTDESFTIELKDIYDEISGDRIKRELTIGDEIYVIEIDKGDATNVYKRNKESKSTEVTVLSSSGTHFTTNITTNGASTVYDENGNVATTNVTTERVAIDFDYKISQIGYNRPSKNINGTLILHYKNGNTEEISINKNTFSSSDEWWGAYNIQKENIIGFDITINSVDENCELIFKGSSDNGDFDWENELVKYQLNKDNISTDSPFNAKFGIQTMPTEDAELYEDKIIAYDVVTTITDFNTEVNTYLTETWTKNIGIYDTETITAFTDGYKSPTTFTTVVEEKKYEYKYDPETLMIMPQPFNTPTFTNDYGLMFSKWGVSNGEFVELLPDAVIDIEDTNGTKVKENILDKTNGSVTINLSDLKENTVYKFVEPDAPNDYEKADPIYFKINGTTVSYGSNEECKDGTFDLIDNGTDNAQSIVMKDTKISGAEIKLSKWNADLTERLSGAEFQLYADTGEGVLIYPLGDNETFTITGEEFNLHDTLKKADDSKYNTEYIKDGYLKEGRYYLREVNAPTGYTAQDKFKFKVNSDNTIEMVESGTPAYVIHPYNYPIGNGNNNITTAYKDITAIEAICKISNSSVDGVKSLISDKKINLQADNNCISGLGGWDPLFNSNLGTLEVTSLGNDEYLISFKIKDGNTISITPTSNDWSVQFQIQDNSVQVTELRIYGEAGEGSGSGGSDNTPASAEITIRQEDSNSALMNGNWWEKFDTSQSTVFERTGEAVHIQDIIFQNANNSFKNTKFNITFTYSDGTTQQKQNASIVNTDRIDIGGLSQDNVTGVKIEAIIEQPAQTTTSDTSSGDSTETTTTPVALNVTVEGDMIKIPNNTQGDKTTISVEKKWADSVKKFPELKPASIQVKLNRYKDDGTTLDNPTTDFEVKTLNEANGWKASWTDLDSKYTDSDGTEKYYKYMVVEETNLQNYENPTYLPNAPTASGTIEITNTPETIEITAEKIWFDGADNTITDNSLLPTEIQVKLQYKGENTDWKDVTDGTYTLTSADGWKKTISDLPAVYEYKIVELNVPNGWEVQETADTAKQGDLNASITNKQQVGSLEINKEWKGDTASDRPNSINIELYRSTQSPVSGSSTIENIPTTNQFENYAKALQYSLYFYDANMCGSEVTEKSAVKWRDDCHTYNTADGGFHDAGDHVMFGLPQGYTASTLGWSYYEFKDAYDSLGQTEHYKTIMDEFARFIKNSTTLDANGNVSTLIWQKGDNDTDHNYWGSPEEQGNYGNELSATSGVSDIAAEYAATLALNYLNFGNEEDLKYAEALYNFSTINSSGSGNNYANASYEDDQAWAESWLYLATNNNKYKENYEKRNLSITSPINDANAIQVHNWYNVTMGAKIAYAHISDDWNEITSWLDNQVKDNNYKNYNSWGSARHNATAQLCALAVAKNISDTDATKAKTYTDWAKSQMNYLLGDNDGNICLLTGYAENSVKHPHHRAASVNQNDANYKHTLVGALVGGPQGTSFANYPDTVNNYTENEVALDYNAGFVGAAAGLYYFYHTGTLADDNTLNALEIDTTKYDETPVNVKNYETIEVTQETGESKDNGVLNIGDERKLVLANSDNKNVTWSSDNQNVATIEKGILTAVEDGTATIKATVNGAVVAEYALTVQIASINTGYISADNGYQLVKSITINADNNNNWSITETNLPLYDANGRKYYYYIKEKDVTKYYAISYTNGVSLDNDTNSVSVTNKKYDNGGVTMPSSGGTGTRNYYVVGACMIGIAGIFLIRRRKKVTE